MRSEPEVLIGGAGPTGLTAHRRDHPGMVTNRHAGLDTGCPASRWASVTDPAPETRLGWQTQAPNRADRELASRYRAGD